MADAKQIMQDIIKGLQDYNQNDVEKYASYIYSSMTAKDRDGNLKNKFLQYRPAAHHIHNFKQVEAQGLVFDGKHVTLQSTGITFDYVAYKNKMLKTYPETKMDFAVVYESDEFTFRRDSGKVSYSHELGNPFSQNENKIIGAYCVIKNNRGEFLTILDKEAIQKHRKVARSDSIWSKWFTEMVKKTIVKKACKDHFDDMYNDIEELDNENYDVENPLDVSVEFKGEIDSLTDLDALREAYAKYKGNPIKMKYIMKRVEMIKKESEDG